MITDVQYMQIVTEEYDLSDYATKKKVLFCNEASKTANIEHIVTRLYQHIKNNIVGIDFGTIPKSKGIITKIENYDQLLDCLNAISELTESYKDPTTTVKEIYSAIDNIKSREREFVKAFAMNIEFPMMIYNMTVLSIVSSVSLLISSSIEFIKNGHDSFSASIDKVGYSKSKDHLLFEYITQFNRNCATGVINKLLDGCIKNNITATHESQQDIINEDIDFDHIVKTAKYVSQPIGALAVALSAPGPLKIVGIIISIGIIGYYFLKIFAKCIAFYLSMRLKMSEWFSIQADFLQINAENLKYREDELGDKHRKEVYQKQIKWVDRFKKISNFLAIKDSKSRKEVKEKEQESSKRVYENDKQEQLDNDDGLF